MQQHYRNTFGTESGRIVLGDILFNLGHFGSILDPNDPAVLTRIGEYNIAVAIAIAARAFDVIYPQFGIKGES